MVEPWVYVEYCVIQNYDCDTAIKKAVNNFHYISKKYPNTLIVKGGVLVGNWFDVILDEIWNHSGLKKGTKTIQLRIEPDDRVLFGLVGVYFREEDSNGSN